MTIKPFFPVFIVLVGVVVWVYFNAERKPEHAAALTPKQYIELVEKSKAERIRQQAEKQTAPTPDTPKQP